MGKNFGKFMVEFMGKGEFIKFLSIIMVLFCLYFPINFVENKLTSLRYFIDKTLSFELFLYLISVAFIVFLVLLFFILLTEIDLKIIIIRSIGKINFFKLSKKIISINKYLMIVVFSMAMIIKIFLLFFTYKLKTNNFENVVENVIHIEIIVYIVNGILCFTMDVLFIFILLVELCRKINRKLFQSKNEEIRKNGT